MSEVFSKRNTSYLIQETDLMVNKKTDFHFHILGAFFHPYNIHTFVWKQAL